MYNCLNETRPRWAIYKIQMNMAKPILFNRNNTLLLYKPHFAQCRGMLFNKYMSIYYSNLRKKEIQVQTMPLSSFPLFTPYAEHLWKTCVRFAILQVDAPSRCFLFPRARKKEKNVKKIVVGKTLIHFLYSIVLGERKFFIALIPLKSYARRQLDAIVVPKESS